MMHTLIVEDGHRQYYRLHLPGDVPIDAAIKPKEFCDPLGAQTFVRGLRVEVDQWRRILHDVHRHIGMTTRYLRDPEVHDAIATLIVRGYVTVYPITHLHHSGQTITYPSIPAGAGFQYRFIPADLLLVKSLRDVQIFYDKGVAEKFIQSLNLTDAQIEAIIQATALRVADGAARNSTQKTAMLIALLAKSEVVLLTERVSASSPKSTVEEAVSANAPGNRPMTLGPHASGSTGSGKSTPAPDTTDWQSLSDDEYRQKVTALMQKDRPMALHAGKPASATEQSWAALEAAKSRKAQGLEPEYGMSAYTGSGVHPAKQFVEGLNTVGENAGSGLFYTAGTTMGLGEAEALKLAGLGGGVFDAGLAAGGSKLGPKYDVLGEMRTTPNKQKLTPTPPLKSASSGEKGRYGEARAKTYMQDEHPNLQKTGRDKGVFENGIDGVYKNKTPPPDYVLVEAKYNTGKLGTTRDGKQMSDGWLTGEKTGFNRIKDAVSKEEALNIGQSLRQGRVEKWLLRADENGGISKRLLDSNANLMRG